MAKLFVVFVILTAVVPLRSVLLGGIPFWYDPGRDLLLAWDNLRKLTLIGPPGGIPGIFYGPYWIWLLSLPMVITHNPRFVVLIAITLPYLVLFPLILWKMRPLLGLSGVFIVWTLFITNFDNYLTFPWSPYLVALVCLALAYLVAGKKSAFLVGVVAALAPNFNFSFGVTVVVATVIWQILTDLRRFPHFLAGVLVAFSPLLLFELRHNFAQTRAFADTFLKSALFNSAVVGQTGMAKSEILPQLASIGAGIFHLPLATFWPVGLILLVWLSAKGLLKDRLVAYLFVCLGTLVAIYFLTKNPVWPYYFIGTETIFLLLLGRLLSKSRTLTVIMATFALFLLVITAVKFFQPLYPNYLTLPTLASKEAIAKYVLADAGNTSWQVFVYSPAIYTYDYDYLFRWLGAKPNPQGRIVYLVVPPTSESVRLDFVHYKTPDAGFRTVWEKPMPDGTLIIKRIKTA